MKLFLRSRVALALLSLPLLLATGACTKATTDPTPTPQTPTPTTGSVSGTVDPAGSISTVTATNAGGLTFPATPDGGGGFRFEGLTAGTYTLSFTPAVNFTQPASRSLTVVAGINTAAGIVTVSPYVPVLRGTMSWQVGTTTYTATTLSGSLYHITATAQTGNQSDILSLKLPGLNGMGIYRLENLNQQNSADYIISTGGVPNSSYSTAVTGGLNGTVTVTSYNAATRTMSGTFGFIAANRVYTSYNLTVSNGSFNLSY